MAVAIKVVKSTKNVLLSRREVEINITHPNQPTPNKELLASEMSSHYSIPVGQIYVSGIKTGYGSHQSEAVAHLYNTVDDLKKIERGFVVSRMTGVVPAKIKRITKKQERVKRRNVFGTEKRNMDKAKRRIKD